MTAHDILFIKSKSLDLAYTQQVGMTQGHDCQETGIIEHHLRSCSQCGTSISGPIHL